MLAPRFISLVAKQVVRHRTRSILTMAGVALAMFLFGTVQAMQAGAARATQRTAEDTTLVVYRKDRYCPFTSRMPQYYTERIAGVPGVASVVPMQITVSNCRTSLDVVTFRGVPEDAFAAEFRPQFDIVAGSFEDWTRRTDAALLGETLAHRRGLGPGDRFEAAGITVYVAGVIRADEPQHHNVAYTHLSFLQFASGSRSGGLVTQFLVRVSDPQRLDEVAANIDAQFVADQEPTHTRAEKAFVAQAASEVLEIVAFTRWLAVGCLAAVGGLIANAIVLAVQDRIREHAIMQTIGYGPGLISRLIVAEGILLSACGGVLGSGLALAVLKWYQFSLSVEGISIPVLYAPNVFAWGLCLSIGLGVAASAIPAWQASRREITECFRAV